MAEDEVEHESELPPPPPSLWEDEEGEGFVGWQPLNSAGADGDGGSGGGGNGNGSGGGGSVVRSLGATRADPDPTDWVLLAGVYTDS